MDYSKVWNKGLRYPVPKAINVCSEKSIFDYKYPYFLEFYSKIQRLQQFCKGPMSKLFLLKTIPKTYLIGVPLRDSDTKTELDTVPVYLQYRTYLIGLGFLGRI